MPMNNVVKENNGLTSLIDLADLLEPCLIKRAYLKDARGTFNKLWPFPTELSLSFDDFYFTTSHKDVFRGFHYQDIPYSQLKLQSVISGSASFCMICMNPLSKNFKEIYTCSLDASSQYTIVCPPMFANGFQANSDKTMILSLIQGRYNAQSEVSIDPRTVEAIPLSTDILLSDKDASGVSFAELL